MSVPTKSEFWVLLHELADEVEKEGRDERERAANLVAQLEVMPPEIVNAYLANLEIVAATVGELQNRCKTR